MSPSDPQHKHRFTTALKAILQEVAKANNRSLTAEVNARLEQSFVNQPSAISPASEASALPVILAMDTKLTALCRHLGVKVES